MRTKIALIGCDNITKKHVHVIQNYLDDVVVVGFCDIMVDRAKEFSEKYGWEKQQYDFIKFYNNLFINKEA